MICEIIAEPSGGGGIAGLGRYLVGGGGGVAITDLDRLSAYVLGVANERG